MQDKQGKIIIVSLICLLIILWILYISIDNPIHYELIKLTLINISSILFFLYMFIYPEVEKDVILDEKAQKKVGRILWGILLLISPFVFYPFFYEFKNYYKKKDNYLKTTKCIVEDIRTFVIFSFVKKEIKCNNGIRLKKQYTLQSFYKGEEFIFTYLPKSKIIVKSVLINSPIEARIKSK